MTAMVIGLMVACAVFAVRWLFEAVLSWRKSAYAQSAQIATLKKNEADATEALVRFNHRMADYCRDREEWHKTLLAKNAEIERLQIALKKAAVKSAEEQVAEHDSIGCELPLKECCDSCRQSEKRLPMTMIVCPICHNKRCPKANDHRNKCTGSNATNQPRVRDDEAND